ncbi:glycosyltransferase family 61 protein [Qipengyuania spongiae]|uniref:Glycosyltransferase family 61 protein n=1 Tax=Qipengyuania spongiae TaxID=2909673 RepID=A0ABY5T2Q0_9SPHN|nr:glycosyltransferase family 61 protein [Qipengyuania spongiae]UVI39561.1 glycosyltransferase family 61 protein [Qipengyuania spongiae]
MQGSFSTDSAAPLETLRSAGYSALWHIRKMPERAIRYGIPPQLFGWRWRRREPLFEYVARQPDDRASLEIVRGAYTESYPLPRNMTKGDLSAQGALWGYAIRDVPNYRVSETYIAGLADMRMVFATTPDKGDFFPAMIGPDGQSIEARETSYRPLHAEASASGRCGRRLGRAMWIWERAYHNHSHWLTAHLPKLLLLKNRNEVDGLVLPERRTKVMDHSMRMIGIEPEDYRTFSFDDPLEIDDLRFVGTDRFAPDLVNSVRAAFAGSEEPTRKIFISRRNSRGRKLVNEDELWPVLRLLGFERFLMEDLEFEQQVELMQQTRILVAPHGAGLTNMIFCPAGGHVLEIADPGFPNPNFYALSSALGLNYALLHARAGKADHPLDRDLTVDVASVVRSLRQIA